MREHKLEKGPNGLAAKWQSLLRSALSSQHQWSRQNDKHESNQPDGATLVIMNLYTAIITIIILIGHDF